MLTFLQYGILFVLVASPLAFGSVEPWAYSTINLLALLFLVLWTIHRLFLEDRFDGTDRIDKRDERTSSPGPNRQNRRNRLVFYPLLAFIVLVVFQLIPLPLSWVRVLSPARVAFVEKLNLQSLGIALPSHLTLSVDPYLTTLALVNLLCLLIYFYLTFQLLNSRTKGPNRRFHPDHPAKERGLRFAESANLETDERDETDKIDGFSLTDQTEQTEQTPFLKRLAFTIISIGFLVALFGIVQKLSGTDKLYWLRPLTHGGIMMGPFANYDKFAGYLELPLGLVLGLLLFLKREAPYRWLLVLAAIVMGAAIFYSGSRGGMLSFLFELACAGILVLALRPNRLNGPNRPNRLRGSLLLIPALLILVIFAVSYIGPDAVLNRFQGRLADEGRWPVWQDTLRVTKSFPVVGTGFGTFRTVFPHFQSGDYAYRFLQTHNDYLQLLSETGILGAGLLLLALLVIVFRALRGDRNGFGLSSAVQQGAMLGVLGLLLHSFFDFNLQIPSNALLFAVCCGMVAGSARD